MSLIKFLALGAFLLAGCELPKDLVPSPSPSAQATSPSSNDSSGTVPGCDSNGKSDSKNPHCIASPSPSPSVPQVSIISNIEGYSLAVDSHSNVFIVGDAAGANQTIWKIAPNGTATAFANNLENSEAYLLAIDKNDNLYVAPWTGGHVNIISSSGTITQGGIIDAYPEGITVDLNGNIYFTASRSVPGASITSTNTIKKIAPDGTVSVFAGSGTPGNADGNGTSASFNDPQGLTTDSAGNIYVVDAGNSLIRKVSPSGAVTTIAGSGIYGLKDGPASSAEFEFRDVGEQPTGIVISPMGDLYVGEAYGAGYLRKVGSDGTVSTYCGNGDSDSPPVAGQCSQSPFYQGGLAIGGDSSIYFSYGQGFSGWIGKISN